MPRGYSRVVAESGIRSAADVSRMQAAGAHGIKDARKLRAFIRNARAAAAKLR